MILVLAGVILALPWYELVPAWPLFVGFFPLLLLGKKWIDEGRGWRYTFFSVFLTFFVWSAIATWWLCHATVGGGIFAFLVTAFLMAITFQLSHGVRKRFGDRMGLIAFVAIWIAYEQFFHNSEVAWPWLTLGNAFGNEVKVIQWYEFTGVLGGSLWVLVGNIAVYYSVNAFIKRQLKLGVSYATFFVLLLALPTAYSYSLYNGYHEKGETANVLVVQPNVDPYGEKFSGLTNDQQVELMLDIALQGITPDVDYVVTPETSIDDRIWEHSITQNYSVNRLRDFVDSYPRAKWISGATTLKLYDVRDTVPPTSRRFSMQKEYVYDRFNSAFQIDTSGNYPIYHKSKLVVGVEMMPYPKYFRMLEKISIDLGGIVGSLGTQRSRGVFYSQDRRFAVAPVICYESVFGEYLSGYTRNGANLIFVVTNDGWWKDTPGYRQHLSYSRIRAIEQRRAIARSANTGISALINQRGDVLDSLGWWKRGSIVGSIRANNALTLYAVSGDFVGRIASLVSALFLLLLLSKALMRKKG
ncbi:MAG: apolipoprotein N-acyltransferase [Bacteroidales bacterium]|nr:apolipoprotein N-acyltransferase [Bacteroidales bacterium]MBN2750444.1 apolipoprotein N-acyltransferase [Bacteroidales bacterium]